ncbi:MAG: peptidylprolyl isomerase [Candidatus Moraniibacteriota bacterium]
MQEKSNEKKIKVQVVLWGLLIFLGLYLVANAVLLYAFDSTNKIVQKTAVYVPYPAAFWGANFISMAELKDSLNSARMFYEHQDFSDIGMRVDFATEDGKKRLKIKEKNILNKLIENRIIENEAVSRGLKLSAEDISQEVSRQMKAYDSEEYLKNNLAKLYGWTIADFENNIVKPDMYREKLSANLRENDAKTKTAKNKIETALGDLKGGKDFTETVKKYSEGESVKNDGELGWFSAIEMLPEIANTVFSLKKGAMSDVIESQLGYHIILVEDQKTEGDVPKLKLKQIFVRTLNFSDWLFETEKKMNIHVLAKDLFWNKNNGQVEFRNADLKNFEENLSKNSPGDISVLF